MSAVLKLSGNDILKYVYLIYDFDQVSDSMCLIMYAEKIKNWKKIFIHKTDGNWNTQVIKRFTKHKSYTSICSKLKLVFNKEEVPNQFDDENLEQTMQNHAAFLLGLCS